MTMIPTIQTDLISGCFRQMNLFVWNSKGLAGNLDHLGVKALTHFSASMTQENRAILINLRRRKWKEKN